jgi:hypothetical protein
MIRLFKRSFFAFLFLLGVSFTLNAGSAQCSKCSSVWCHSGWFSTKCSVFDKNGDWVGDLGGGGLNGSVAEWCEYVDAGGGC